MKDLRRLVDSVKTSDYERWLLRSAAAERPSSTSLAAMRANLGLPTVWVPLRTTSISGLKMALLAVSVGAFLGLHGTESAPAPGNSPIAIETSRSVAIAPVDAKRQDTAPAEVLEPAVDEPVAEPLKAKRPSVSQIRPTLLARNTASSGPDLREEIRLLDNARNAIKAHQAEPALETLNTYASRFPAGSFKQEASVLRIQAVALRGELVRASSMAKQFVETNPNSPYVGKASRIAEGTPGAGVPR